ncbi:MAG: hypothetical protein LBJ77_01725 [Holosporales bacterium]|nr:hypothetical protein [Holosporales bacterium]
MVMPDVYMGAVEQLDRVGLVANMEELYMEGGNQHIQVEDLPLEILELGTNKNIPEEILDLDNHLCPTFADSLQKPWVAVGIPLFVFVSCLMGQGLSIFPVGL